MSLPVSLTASIITMSSLELVEYINKYRNPSDAEVQHYDLLKKVPKVLGEVAGNFSGYYIAANGKQNPCYNFPKREACLMAMSYSYELQAKVFDRMTELESHASPKIPQTYAAALLEAGRLAMELEQSQEQLAIAAPKAEFIDRYVDSSGTYGFRQAAKMLDIKESEFRDFLLDNAIMYRLCGKLTAYANHIEAGRFIQRAGVAENEHAYTESRLTAKGITWLAGEIASSKAKSLLESN